MEYVRLGSTGMKVSRVALGMMSYGDPEKRPWSLDLESSEPIVRRAVEAGVTFFDTADVYSWGASEEITGKLLGKLFAHRDDYVLATKVYSRMGDGPNEAGLSRKHIMASIDNSLRRLGTDYVDLYQVHRWDGETPVEETMEALHDLVKAGKVRYIGASSMYAWQFAKAQYTATLHGWTRYVTMQNHYNLVYREEEREMNPLCLDLGVGLLPWSPLARGLLTGSRSRSGSKTTRRAQTDEFAEKLYDESDFDVVDVVVKIAAEREVPPAQVALAWLLHQPAVTAPIFGATREAHVDDAVAAVSLSLSEGELGRLAEPYRPHAIKGH
ncbi:aldo/keto reductase [Virgisporangium aliadipatigenens]|uniref:Aldo/keto reductase n=1 Tax=Virgisporangium aliadipatigenens TaxID=741659 RepID=A0A8J3YMX9_9ACTN|nr:aldo/keto reductase [Virgisporangium aliadipatigenens]GIJ48484.1 aldo/keto reductase [Virgisporangium aliadipatigenens]